MVVFSRIFCPCDVPFLLFKFPPFGFWGWDFKTFLLYCYPGQVGAPLSGLGPPLGDPFFFSPGIRHMDGRTVVGYTTVQHGIVCAFHTLSPARFWHFSGLAVSFVIPWRPKSQARMWCLAAKQNSISTSRSPHAERVQLGLARLGAAGGCTFFFVVGNSVTFPLGAYFCCMALSSLS